MRLELDWVESRARLTPDAEAIVDVEQARSWTFAELNKRSEAASSWLRKKGVNKGDRVALLSP
ncbi:MAG TPA: AMP-binding protein, partial [Bacillus sp. (in: firmicutes)]